MRHRGLRVYVSGPYTGNVDANIRNALLAADALINAGHYPFVPHAAFQLLSIMSPRSYEDWMDQCLAWIPACDVLYRLPGASAGADREVVRAQECGLRVTRDLAELTIGPVEDAA